MIAYICYSQLVLIVRAVVIMRLLLLQGVHRLGSLLTIRIVDNLTYLNRVALHSFLV